MGHPMSPVRSHDDQVRMGVASAFHNRSRRRPDQHFGRECGMTMARSDIGEPPTQSRKNLPAHLGRHWHVLARVDPRRVVKDMHQGYLGSKPRGQLQCIGQRSIGGLAEVGGHQDSLDIGHADHRSMACAIAPDTYVGPSRRYSNARTRVVNIRPYSTSAASKRAL